jgi:hypothetical protein
LGGEEVGEGGEKGMRGCGTAKGLELRCPAEVGESSRILRGTCGQCRTH